MVPEDRVLLEAIVEYGDVLSGAVADYAIDKVVLEKNPALRGMVAFFVQQIGECTKKLSSDFQNKHPEIEWRAMSGLRNRIAHAYGKVDVEILWDVVRNDVPEFVEFCRGELTGRSLD